MARTAKSAKKTKKSTKAVSKKAVKKQPVKKAASKSVKKSAVKKAAVKKSAAKKVTGTQAKKKVGKKSPALRVPKLTTTTAVQQAGVPTAVESRAVRSKVKAGDKVKARQMALARAQSEADERAASAEVPEIKKRGRKSKASLEALDGLSKLGKKWAALYRKTANLKVPTYSMRGTYEEKSPIQHKILGWGYILSNKNDRLEVLFKDGIRFLISNYKA